MYKSGHSPGPSVSANGGVRARTEIAADSSATPTVKASVDDAAPTGAQRRRRRRRAGGRLKLSRVRSRSHAVGRRQTT